MLPLRLGSSTRSWRQRLTPQALHSVLGPARSQSVSWHTATASTADRWHLCAPDVPSRHCGVRLVPQLSHTLTACVTSFSSCTPPWQRVCWRWRAAHLGRLRCEPHGIKRRVLVLHQASPPAQQGVILICSHATWVSALRHRRPGLPRRPQITESCGRYSPLEKTVQTEPWRQAAADRLGSQSSQAAESLAHLVRAQASPEGCSVLWWSPL